jgi:hypothetical protein
MDSSRENSISVLGRELLLVDVGGGAETHLAAVAREGGRSAEHQGNDPAPADGRWERSTMCGRTWNRMAAGADELRPLWRDPAFAPTCRSCLRILDTWFPAADSAAGVHLLAAVVAEEVIQFSSAFITSIPVEQVEAVRRAVRQALRSAGFRSNTTVVDGVVHVWSDDAYQALDPAQIKKSVTGAIERAMSGSDSPAIEQPVGPGPIEPPWVCWRLGLLVSNPGGVGLLGSVERCLELGGRRVTAVAVEAVLRGSAADDRH